MSGDVTAAAETEDRPTLSASPDHARAEATAEWGRGPHEEPSLLPGTHEVAGTHEVGRGCSTDAVGAPLSPAPAGTRAGGAASSVGAASSAPTGPPFGHTPDFLLDVRLTVSVEVGRVQMPLRRVMELGPGSVIELSRGASEPVEVFANGRCIGRGEIVIVGEYFGVRLTELGSVS